MNAEVKPKRQWRESKAAFKSTIADQARRLDNQAATILLLIDDKHDWRLRAVASFVVNIGLALGWWLL